MLKIVSKSIFELQKENSKNKIRKKYQKKIIKSLNLKTYNLKLYINIFFLYI